MAMLFIATSQVKTQEALNGEQAFSIKNCSTFLNLKDCLDYMKLQKQIETYPYRQLKGQQPQLNRP